jgi:hypothetical protein
VRLAEAFKSGLKGGPAIDRRGKLSRSGLSTSETESVKATLPVGLCSPTENEACLGIAVELAALKHPHYSSPKSYSVR